MRKAFHDLPRGGGGPLAGSPGLTAKLAAELTNLVLEARELPDPLGRGGMPLRAGGAKDMQVRSGRGHRDLSPVAVLHDAIVAELVARDPITLGPALGVHPPERLRIVPVGEE